MNNSTTINIRKRTQKSFGYAKVTTALVGVLASYNTSVLAGESDAFTLEEIIVTARKTQENLQEVPIAVTAITGEGLAMRDITSLLGVTNMAPNVKFGVSGSSTGSSSAGVAYIRGVGQIDFTLVTDPGVGVYVDDVYYARTIGSVVDLFDISRIEVLRGPQGTLFGRNSIGGAISVYSTNPSDEYEGSGRVTLGDDNRVETYATVHLPLTDKFRMMVSAIYKNRDGYVKDADGQERGDENMWGVRIKTVFDATDDLSIRITGDYIHEKEGGSAEVPLTSSADGSVDIENTNPYFTPVTSAQGTSGTDLETGGVSMVINYSIDDNYSLKSVTAYRKLDAVFNRNPSSFLAFHTTDPYEHSQFTQELQLNGEYENFSFVTGLFYMTEDGSNVATVEVGIAPATWPRLLGVSDISNKNWATFGEVTMNVTDELRLIVGGRYTKEDKEATFVAKSIPGVTRGGSFNSLAFSGPQSVNFNKFTYRVVAQYDLTDDVMTYASYSTGFKSGGFNQRYVGNGTDGQFTAPDSFLPEELASYEMGVKFQNDDVRINVAGFFSDYKNIQISGAPIGSIATETFNGGKAEIIGIELEATWTVTPNFLLDISGGYQDAKYKQLDGNNLELSLDDEFVYTPPYTVSIGASYLHELGDSGKLRARVDFFTSGALYFEPNNSIASYEDGYSTLNASITYLSTDDSFSITFGVNNITDSRYLVSGDANAALRYNEGIFARSRNWYLTLQTQF